MAPDAGPGAFTSVKYSGQPPGGKSSITFWKNFEMERVKINYVIHNINA